MFMLYAQTILWPKSCLMFMFYLFLIDFVTILLSVVHFSSSKICYLMLITLFKIFADYFTIWCTRAIQSNKKHCCNISGMWYWQLQGLPCILILCYVLTISFVYVSVAYCFMMVLHVLRLLFLYNLMSVLMLSWCGCWVLLLLLAGSTEWSSSKRSHARRCVIRCMTAFTIIFWLGRIVVISRKGLDNQHLNLWI